MHIHGGCHCENTRLELHWPTTGAIPARACSCTFCTKHGAVWTSHRDAKFVITIDDPGLVNKYRFATATAEFFLCTRCGVVVCATSEIDQRTYAVVNVNAFRDVATLAFTRVTGSFDGEEVTDRLTRRARNWIPDVRIIAQSA